MKQPTRLLLGAALIAAFGAAHAITGNDALQRAKTPAGEAAVISYVRGMMEVEGIVLANARQLSAVGQTPAFPAYCIPDDATAAQGWAIVNKLLTERPDVTHHEFGALARSALLRAWPCR